MHDEKPKNLNHYNEFCYYKNSVNYLTVEESMKSPKYVLNEQDLNI